MSSGIFGQLNGFETEIFEKHFIAGGECTGWNRGGYYFDNCIHWLVGSKPGTVVNKLLREVGALDDSVDIVNTEYFYRVEENGQAVNMYRDVNRLEAHLIAISPQDTPAIHELCKGIRAFSKIDMPIDKPMDMYSILDNVKMFFKMLPFISLLNKYGKISVGDLAERFKNPLIQDAIKLANAPGISASIVLMIFSSFNSGDSGIPKGGSKRFADRMVKKYLSLGGKIHYNSPVDKIKIEDGKAVGVLLEGGQEQSADVVVSATDGNFTLQHMLEGKYIDEKLEILFSDPVAYPTFANVKVSVGIACDLSDESHEVRFKPSHPIDAGGISNEWLMLTNYNYDKCFAPAGKSVLSTFFMMADYDWWKQKHQDREAYKAEKKRVAREVCAAIEEKYPQVRGKIEQVDVATPVTYERFCNAWRGAFMSWGPTPKSKIRYLSGKLKGLNNLYMTGQWTMLPGINGAAITGKWVIQRICKDLKVNFKKD